MNPIEGTLTSTNLSMNSITIQTFTSRMSVRLVFHFLLCLEFPNKQ